MENRLIKTLFCCCSVILIIACQSGDSDQNELQDPNIIEAQIKPEYINIGSIAARPSRRDAMLLAVKQINQSGGVLNKPINLVSTIRQNILDSTQIAEDMVTSGIEIIQVSGSSRSKVIMDALIDDKIVIISESATSPSLASFVDQDFLFSLAPSDIYQGRVLAELAINQGALNAVIVINQDDIFGSDLAQQFQLNFEQLGGVISNLVSIPVDVETDFSEYMDAIYEHQPDVILNAMLLPEFAANQINAAVQLPFNGFYLFPDTIAGKPEFINNLIDLELVNNALGASSGFGFNTNPEFEYFRDSFVNQFSLQPQTFNVTAYDFAMITALAIEKAGYYYQTNSPDAVQIRNSLREIMNPPGEIIGPSQIGRALSLISNGQEVNYSGAYSATDWDQNGSVFGEVVYNIFLLDAHIGDFVVSGQLIVDIPPPDNVVIAR